MAKYARIKDGYLTDVWRVPEDYPDVETRDRCLGRDDWVEVSADAVNGAQSNGDGTYTNPVIHIETTTPSTTLGRDLTWDEFLDVAMAADATKTNAILLNMPVVAEFGRKYIAAAGIQFGDASDPTARLARLMAAAKAAGLINDVFLAMFMQKWVELFPLMVPASE